jgi:hypothetical protein
MVKRLLSFAETGYQKADDAHDKQGDGTRLGNAGDTVSIAMDSVVCSEINAIIDHHECVSAIVVVGPSKVVTAP